MNSIEIKNVMRVVRQAIWLVYGRQSLKLYGYMILDSKTYFPYYENVEDYMPSLLWVEIESEKGNHYKVKIEKGEVVSLREGSLNI